MKMFSFDKDCKFQLDNLFRSMIQLGSIYQLIMEKQKRLLLLLLMYILLDMLCKFLNILFYNKLPCLGAF